MFTRPRGFALGIALFSVVSMLLPGAAASAAGRTGTTFPVKVHGANGTVTVATRPTAIVSLSPTATEMLYSIGAGSQVKAVDEYSDYPSGTPMTSLDGDDPNVEAIASYKPDLVVVSQEAPGLNKQLVALGIPVLYDPAADQPGPGVRSVRGAGQGDRACRPGCSRGGSLKCQIAKIVASVHKPAHSESYYYELDQTYYSETSSTFIGQVLGLLGLHSIADAAKGAAASGGYPQLSGEYILKANPGYILLADTICCAQSAATVAARPGWSNLAAVKDGRVLGLNDDIASRWGPRIVILLREVAAEMKQHPVSGQS